MDSSYIDQAKRIVRSFQKIPSPNYPDSTPEEVWDAYYHFFQDVYHLKDWILNDDTIGIGKDKKEKRKKLNEFIESNINMRLLQSVVTNIKHLKAESSHIAFKEIGLTWSEQEGPKPSPAITYDDLVFLVDDKGNFILGDDGDAMEVEYETKTIHPRKLAIEVLVTWNKFLEENDLKGSFEIVNI